MALERPARAPTSLLLAVFLVAGVCALAGCHERPGADTDTSRRPLRPLVYTESDESSPRAAAARDRRLMRQLVGSAASSDHWGRLTRRSPPPRAATSEKLGRLLFEGLIAGGDDAWDGAFVSSSDYASLVGVDPDRAREKVSHFQGASIDARRAFRSAPAARTPEGGVDELFERVELELGAGKRLDGSEPTEASEVRQYWHSELVLETQRRSVTLRVRIPKIVRVGADGGDGSRALAVASALELGPRLETFLAAGFHLDSRLLRPSEYPFPLHEGNFWRYRRRAQAGESRGGDPPEPDVRELVVDVVRVERFGAYRLVELTAASDDGDHQRRRHLLSTPRRIYTCNRRCRRAADELPALLDHLAGRSPLYNFPLELREAWPADDPRVRVGEDLKTVQTPAGTFHGSFTVLQTRPDGRDDLGLPEGRVERRLAYVTPGKGVVRREFDLQSGGRTTEFVDTLVDYRLIPD